MTEESGPGPGPIPGPANDLARQLPAMIETALRRYRDFTDIEPPTKDTKLFAAHATASKAALAHLEQLLKLARMVDAKSSGAVGQPVDIQRLIADAEAALSQPANDT